MESDDDVSPPSTPERLSTAPTPPPRLEDMQERHEAHVRWCAGMLEASINDRAAVRELLSQARQRRETAMLKMRVAKSLREAAEILSEKYQHHLDEVSANCSQIVKELEAERKWRPASITMSGRHQQELRERVKRLKAILVAKTHSRHGLPLDCPLAKRRRT